MHSFRCGTCEQLLLHRCDGWRQECDAAASAGCRLFDDAINARANLDCSSATSEDAPATVADLQNLPASAPMSLRNLLVSPLTPRSAHLMNHAGTSASGPGRDCASVRLQCIARCLRACSTWAMQRGCRFDVALRTIRLCKIALGDLFSASSQESEGWMELKSAAAEWTRRLREEAGVAMRNVDACQFFEENRKQCQDIVNFETSRGGGARLRPALMTLARASPRTESGEQLVGCAEAACDS